LNPSLVKDREKRVIAEMSAIVDIGDADRDLSRENGSGRKMKLHSWHWTVSVCENKLWLCSSIVGKKGATVNEGGTVVARKKWWAQLEEHDDVSLKGGDK
jgi:hypothetical protein